MPIGPIAILREHWVRRKQAKRLCYRLRQKKTVEWIVMVIRQTSDPRGMPGRYRQLTKATILYRLDKILRVPSQAAQSGFYGNFPDRHRGVLAVAS